MGYGMVLTKRDQLKNVMTSMAVAFLLTAGAFTAVGGALLAGGGSLLTTASKHTNLVTMLLPNVCIKNQEIGLFSGISLFMTRACRGFFLGGR